MAVITFKTPYWYQITYQFEKHYYYVDSVKVLDILDGDTFTGLYKNKRIRIRLYGIDAPELNQPYGLNSRQILSRLISNKIVELSHISKGKYGRTIAMVHYDGLNVNAEMVRLGAAWVYDEYCEASLRKTWNLYQYKAKRNRLGLWQFDNPVRPSTWRRL